VSAGALALAHRAAARRSVRALALTVAEVLRETGTLVPEVEAWLATWETSRVAEPPGLHDDRTTTLLCALHDARLDVWRHVTHEPRQRRHILRLCARLLVRFGALDVEAAAWLEDHHGRHDRQLQLAEIAEASR
jgi:hypothetical protein